MRLKQEIQARLVISAATTLALCLFATDRQVFAFEQQPPAVAAPVVPTPAQVPAPPTGPEIQLTADEAVRLALENNLGIKSDRLSPDIAALNVAQARAAFTPALFSTTSTRSATAPPDFLASGGASTATTSERVFTSVGVQQATSWFGARYSVGLDASKSTVNYTSSFNPRLDSNLTLQLTQPLLRNFMIDAQRQQVMVAKKNEEIADLDLRQQITVTERGVRSAYYALLGAMGQLDVARQSLELSQTSLRQNRRRVEVGAMAEIDILQTEAEVAQREEAVIVAEANIKSLEDALRAVILNPQQPDFWSVRLVPTEQPTIAAQPINVEAAITNAIAIRTDLAQARKRYETSGINLDYARNQRLPDVNLVANYNTIGVAGTQFNFGDGFPPRELGRIERSFQDALSDVFGNDFKTWSLLLQVNYPIGTSQAEALVASTRLQREQEQNGLRELEISIAAQVREAGRRVNTSLQRVQSTERARTFAERRLEAEEKRQTAGLGTTFEVIQAQRDLSSIRQQEQRAIIDYNLALVDFQAVQQAPLGGGR
jgi:outer membrane protein